MRKLNGFHIVLILAVLALLAGLVYWLPPVHDRLSWRVDFALTYIRGVLKPVKAMPTSLPIAMATATPANLVTPTLAPASTLTGIENLTPTAALSSTLALTPTLSPSPAPLPASVALPPPRWEKQDINNCGPAALTMYLRFYGWEGDQTDIAEVIKPIREDRNVNVEELVYFVRTHAGWLNIQYRVGGDLGLLKQLLAAGFPVMIEESFYFEEPFWPNDDLWGAHYQLLTGYDEAMQIFLGQDSYRGSDQKIPYNTVDTYWQAFNRVYILVYLPHQEEAIKAILGADWDADANRQHALEKARAETETDPDNAFTWFNLGSNYTYFEKYLEASQAYDHARQVGLPQRMLRYQFGPFIAYFHTGQFDELIALTEYALKITPRSEEAWLWHGWAMYRKGKINDAIADFEKALEENPNYLDAQYALDFVRSNP